MRDSDATLIVTPSEKLSGGSQRTADFAQRLGKPWMHFRPRVHPKYVARFLAKHQVRVLNVAGPRESGAPEIVRIVVEVLNSALLLPARVEL